MQDVYKPQEPEETVRDEQPEAGFQAREEVREEQAAPVSGTVHISEEVLTELAKKTLSSISGVQPASPGIVSKLGIGRKASDGIRVSVEDKAPQEVSVDVYVLVKYGLRIPDVAWDVQESIKNNLEEYTGYAVKAVNINVQGIYFEEKTVPPAQQEEGKNQTETHPGAGTEPENTLPPEIEQL